MRRDFTQVLCNLDGTPAKDEKQEEITLCKVALMALLASSREPVAAEQKARRFQLAQKINANPAKVDITAEEMSLVKAVIGEIYSPLVVGRSYELLEQELKAAESAS